MSAELDLFVEETMARHWLDDAQRAHWGPLLHRWMETAIADGMADGMAPAAAEAGAMRLLGRDVDLSRQLKSLHGRRWLLFEAAAYALTPLPLLVLLLLLLALKPAGIAPEWSVLSIAAGLVYMAGLFMQAVWPRIRVNETLELRRPFRPAVRIAFDDIGTVRRLKMPGKLFGPEQLVIEHAKGKWHIGTDHPQARHIVLALRARASGAITSEAHDFILQLIERPRRAAAGSRMALTLVWLATLAALAAALAPTWRLDGLSWWLAGAVGLGTAGAAWQAHAMVARHARALSYLLLTGLLFTLPLMAAIVTGPVCLVQLAWLAVAGLTGLGLLVLRHRGSRAGVTTLIISGLVMLLALLPYFWRSTPPHVRMTVWNPGAEFAPFISTGWVEQPATTCAAVIGNQLILADGRRQARRLVLTEGEWCLLDTAATDTLTLAHAADTKSTASVDIRLMRLASNGDGPPEHFATIEHPFLTSITAKSFPFWSPGRDYYLAPRKAAASDPLVWDLTIVDRRSGEAHRAPGMFSRNMAWLDDHTLRVIRMNGTTHMAQLWRIAAPTGEVTLDKELALPRGHVPDLMTAGWLFLYNEARRQPMGRINLQTGAVDLLDYKIRVLCHNPAGDEMVYITQWDVEEAETTQRTGTLLDPLPRTRRQAGQTLVIETQAAGRIEWPLRAGEEIAFADVAPDGRKVLLADRTGVGMMLAGAKLWIYDCERNRERPLWYGSVMQGLEFASGMTLPNTLRAWSPDSRTVAVPITKWPLPKEAVKTELIMFDMGGG